MAADPKLRNILLKARHLFFEGFADRWDKMPQYPSSSNRSIMVQDLARELDSMFRACIIHNFVGAATDYFSNRMTRTFGDWLSSHAVKSLASFICTSVFHLPMDSSNNIMDNVENLAATADSISDMPHEAQEQIHNLILTERKGLEQACDARIVSRAPNEVLERDKVDLYDCIGVSRTDGEGAAPMQTPMLILMMLYMLHEEPDCRILLCPQSSGGGFITFSDRYLTTLLSTQGVSTTDHRHAIEHVFDIGNMATVQKDRNINLKKRHYYWKLRKLIPNSTDEARYTISQQFKNDGTRLSLSYVD